MSVPSDHMMQFRRTLSFLGLAAGMIVLVGLVWIAYAALQEQQHQRDEARTLREGLRTVRSFFSHLQDAETGQRGFLLTSDPAYLGPYQAALTLLPTTLTQLDRLAPTLAQETGTVQSLIQLTNERLTELNESLALAKQSPAQALALMKSGHGQTVMDRIRGATLELEQRWSQSLMAIEENEQRLRYRTDASMLAGAVLALILLGIGAMLLIRDRAEMERVEQLYARAHVMEAVPVLVREWQGKIRFWSEGMERVFGWSKAEAVGRRSTDLLRMQTSTSEPEIETALWNHGRWQGELRCLRRDGTERTVAVQRLLRPGGEERSGTVVEVFTDVTDLRRAQNELLAAQERFRVLADNMSQFAWMADERGHIYWYNRRWYEYTGTTLEEMQGWGWQEVHHPDHVTRVVSKIRRCFETGEPWEDTFPLRAKDGTYRWFLSRAVPLRDAEGRITLWLGTNTDISERIHAERDRARLAAIVTASDDAIVGKDLEGTITAWNPAAERLFGYAAKEIIGRKITELIPTERLDEESRIMREIRAGRRIPAFESRRRRKDGTEVDVSVSISPVFDETGAPVGAAKIARDITEEIRSRLALKESQANLARELAATQALYEMGLRVSKADSLTEALQIALDSSMHLLGADFGDIRLCDEASGELHVVAQRGFTDEFLKRFERIHGWDDTACGRAMRQKTRIVIKDVLADPGYEPYRAAAAAAGFRALQSTPLVDSSGALLGMISTHFREPHEPGLNELRLLDLYVREAIDAIARTRSAEALRNREEFNRLLFDSSSDCVNVLDVDGRLLATNKSGLQTMEIDDFSAIAGRQWWDLWPPDGQAIVRRSVEQARAGDSSRFSGYCETAKGSARWWDAAVAPVRDASDRVTRVLAILRDVTDSRRNQEAIRLSEIRFRTLTELIPQLVWTCTADGACDYLSQQWFTYTGTTLEDNLGHGWAQLIHPEDRERTVEAWAKAVAAKGEIPFSVEYRLRRYDGTYRWHLARAQALHTLGHGAIKWFGTTTDIESQKQHEALLASVNRSLEERGEALAAANKELEAFSYSVSHDLRAPLRTMSGFAQALLEDFGPTLESEAVRYLTIIGKGAQQMGQLIDDLLAFSRLSRQELERKPLSLAELLEEVRFDLRADQENRTIEWQVMPLPRCLGDRATIKLVLANLIGNALKYTRPRPVARIEVGWRPDEGDPRFCLVYIKDNGVGFDMRYADKLFGVFQRLHRADEFEGTGVGLANVQRIIRRHGGRVGADGIVDGGATFFFTLEMLNGIHSHSL